jgi:hypothetical protein
MDIDTLTIGEAKQAIERGKAIEAALGGKVSSAPASDARQRRRAQHRHS